MHESLDACLRTVAAGSKEEMFIMSNAAMSFVRLLTIMVGAVASGVVGAKQREAQQIVKVTLLSNAIQVETNRAKAGPVTLDVHNAASDGQTHELVVLKTGLADGALPLRGNQVPEQKFKKLGEVEDIASKRDKRMTIRLSPGHYVLICNKPGHYSMGMHTSLTVTP